MALRSSYRISLLCNDWTSHSRVPKMLLVRSRNTKYISSLLIRAKSTTNVPQPGRKNKCKGMQKVKNLSTESVLPTRGAAFTDDNGSLEELTPPEMQLAFLGTGAMAPTPERNVSSLILRIRDTTWMFDCGEGTQNQYLKFRMSTPSPVISRIFITHMHGDHFFGLPALMCGMSSAPPKYSSPPLEIYGPKGLRNLLRSILKSCRAHLSYRYQVHELHFHDSAGQDSESYVPSGGRPHPQEVIGKDIMPGTDGLWYNLPSHNEDVSMVTVHAAPLRHRDGMSSFGFILKEKDYPGKMYTANIRPKIFKPDNAAYLHGQGMSPHLALRNLKMGKSVQLTDCILHPDECLGPTKKGRKIVILGDTCDSRKAASLSANATLVIHEATNAFLPHLFGNRSAGGSNEAVIWRAISNGHSVPQMAGAFAEAVQAETLILTHISNKFSSKGSAERREEITESMKQLAAEEYSGEVLVAEDFMNCNVRAPWAKKWPTPFELVVRSRGNPAPRKMEELSKTVVLPKSIYKASETAFPRQVTPQEAAANAANHADRFLEIASSYATQRLEDANEEEECSFAVS